jgi:RNA polymerase sigma-70 factor, ECF subfamily
MSLTLPFLKSRPKPLASRANFALFYEQSHHSVFRYLMVLCAGQQDEAEDLLAEAFLKAWEKRNQFDGPEEAATRWVITIARNLLIDRHRARTSRPLETELEEEVAEVLPAIEDLIVNAQQTQQVLAAIHALPFGQGDILTLRFVLGWRVTQIAQHLNLPENTISVTLRRALQKIQGQLLTQD